MRKRMMVAGLALATGVVLLQPAMATAMTPRKASLSSSGIENVRMYTYQDSSDGWVTFRLRDGIGLGTTVSQCDITARGARVNCDTYRLAARNYRGGAWKVRRVSQGWEIRIYIGYYSASAAQCWNMRTGQSAGVQISILAGRNRVVAKDSHLYQMRCDGVAANATAPATLVARQGRDSIPFDVKATVLDREHVAKTVRRCFYDVDTREITNCYNDPITKVARRTATGWTMVRTLSYDNTSSRSCRYYVNERPRKEYRISFRDRSGDSLGGTSVSFRLTCRW